MDPAQIASGFLSRQRSAQSKAAVIVPKVGVTLDQLAKALGELSPGELETLEVLLNPELRVELKDRWTKAKGDLKKGKTLSKGELIAE